MGPRYVHLCIVRSHQLCYLFSSLSQSASLFSRYCVISFAPVSVSRRSFFLYPRALLCVSLSRVVFVCSTFFSSLSHSLHSFSRSFLALLVLSRHHLSYASYHSFSTTMCLKRANFAAVCRGSRRRIAYSLLRIYQARRIATPPLERPLVSATTTRCEKLRGAPR